MTAVRRALAFAAVAAVAALAACRPPEPSRAGPARPSDAYTPVSGQLGQTRISFRIPRLAGAGGVGPEAPTLATLPFPSELWRRDGRLSLSGYPGAGQGFLGAYVEAAEKELDGFSIAPVVYFHFEGPASTAGLPRTPAESLTPAANLFLLDVDPRSPERGVAVPIETRLWTAGTSYVPAGLLAVKPLAGFVLRPGTLYAAVVRRGLGGMDGAPLGTTDDLEAVKWTAPRSVPEEEAARLLHQDALAVLGERGVARGDVAALAVFRTGRPERDAAGALAAVSALPDAMRPRIVEATWGTSPVTSGPAGHDLIHGIYCTPNLQRDVDAAPFLSRGGELVRDASGNVVVVPLGPQSRHASPECGAMLRARFVLTVPRRDAPPGGFPLMISAHGTGGSAYDFVGGDDFSGWAAQSGIAVVSTDQPLHGAAGDPGARPGVGAKPTIALGPLRIPLGNGLSAPMLFYNPMRPLATRGNMAQAVADAAVLARLFAGLDLARTVGARGPLFPQGTIAPPPLSSTRVLVAGHSQGSQSLSILGALDPRVRAVLLSGCGGDVRYGVLGNKEFGKVRDILEGFLGLAPGELSPAHPLLALVQMLADASDPQTFARYYRELLPGREPRSLLHVEGMGDGYNPMDAAEALAIALRAAPLAPLARPVPGLSLLGIQPQQAVRGNAVGGRATLAFVQIAPSRGEDGHFVLFREPQAGELASRFLGAAAQQDVPLVR